MWSFRIIAHQFDLSNLAVLSGYWSTLEVGLDIVTLVPTNKIYFSCSTQSIDHQPAEGNLGDGAVAGQEVEGSELEQMCPGVGEE